MAEVKKVNLERRILLKGPLAWDPNRELNGPDHEIQKTEKAFKAVFDQYIGHIVLVQGIDKNIRLMTGAPKDRRLFILQHGKIEYAERRELGSGGNFFLGFSDGNTSAIRGYGWFGYLRILDFIDGEIARVTGSKGEIIYEDSREIANWNKFYRAWRHNGALPSRVNDKSLGSIADYSSNQIMQREIQKALSESLLVAYRIKV